MVDNVSGALTLPAFGQMYGRTVSDGRHHKLALWYIDIRNFRAVNPKYGYTAGNYVLKTMHEGIRRYLSNDLPVTRLGGDRFVLLSEDLDLSHAENAYEKLVPYMTDRIAEKGIKQPLVLSAGIYFLRDNDYNNPSFQRPLDYTSIAHRKAKLNRIATLVPFSDEDLEKDNRRITIEASIDEALATGQIEVWYQPQVDYTYDEIIGAEALARWKHPELGWISPEEFIPVLEKCGKIHNLDLFVWEEACRNAGRWRSAADGSPVPISVNVSRVEVLEADLLNHFLNLRRKYDLPPGSLRLEVTESAFVEGSGRLTSVIEEMRNNDMVVEMDDFGSGLSSLSMLRDVPVDVVKLDMKFMQSTVSKDRGGVVLGSVIRMLQGLDTPIIAEGVETLEQAEMLKNMGCHLMQGYHFSHPMPLAEFESFLETNRTVERSERRERQDAHLDELLSLDTSSSYLFNHAIGGVIFFFAGNGTSESILVNDRFYEECGLHRAVFGSTKINPIEEIAPDSRGNMWRAAAEARDRGVALCRAEVRLTGRWFEGLIRYLGPSSRGDVYSLSIIRSWKKGSSSDRPTQLLQDLSWNMDILNRIVPTGYVKCRLDADLSMSSLPQKLVETSGLSAEEYVRRYHNSFMECVFAEDRPDL
ncbi:MAG: bifunctional diguanylate cyclase/phosphodiesterase, partial [Coriobacteriales bacterium]|nr:bifunctional diguanylate cyclase/phosphodiesterase [Coriobacteriales bacterium]